MGKARAHALALWCCVGASLCSLPAWAEGTVRWWVDAPGRAVLASPRPQVSARGEAAWVLDLPDRRLFVSAQSLPVDRIGGRWRGLLLGYRMTHSRAEVQFRAGYRYGLPLAEVPVYEDHPLVLTSGSAISVSAGTVTRLQLELDSFREIAGSRIMRLEAVPGLRFRFGVRSPVEAGMGMLAGLRPPWEGGGFLVERLTGVVQMSGQF